MSTTSGNMNSFKVTDKNGNVFDMTPVDTEARQAIDEAMNLQFDDDYFTAEVSQDQSTVNVGLNGVPIGVETPLQFTQDDENGIVIGIDTSSLTVPEMTGATASTDGEAGLVPAPDAGDENKFLKGDGTWADVGGGGGGGADLPPYSDEDKAVLANQAGTMSWDKGFATTSYVEEKINQFIVYDPLEGGGSAGNFKTLSLCHDDTLDVVENKEHPGWTRELTVKTPLPAPDSGYSDEGKILRVGIANELEWVNSSAVVEVDNTTMQYNEYGSLEVKLPIPDPTNNDGKVLTVEHNSLTNTDDVVWKDAGGGGGGGGGNPYTKVSVTPGARYKNGTTSDYGWELYDQDVTISNNTYSVVNTDIGYDSTADFPDARNIDKLKIKLPANTDFPMAVVEFRISPYNDGYVGAVNDVEVYVGETKLTKIYSHPYRKDILVGTNLDSNEGPVHETEWGQNYWHINGIHDSNKLFSKTAFVATEEVTPIVQVNIFGNCFTLSTNAEAEEPSAS